MTDVCPDCQRPRPLSAIVWEAMPILGREKFCAVLFEIPGREDDALIPCLIGERDLLRSELASARAQVELTEAERKVVALALLDRERSYAAMLRIGENPLVHRSEFGAACDELLALRAKEKADG